MLNHFICETCGRDMGDIDEPVCHECEQHEIDALAERGLDRYGESLEEPSHDDTVMCCPDCESPNQFGELCIQCARERGEQPYGVIWDGKSVAGGTFERGE